LLLRDQRKSKLFAILENRVVAASIDSLFFQHRTLRLLAYASDDYENVGHAFHFQTGVLFGSTALLLYHLDISLIHPILFTFISAL